MGYNNLSIQEILAYIYDRFRKVSTLELEEVKKNSQNRLMQQLHLVPL